MDWSIIPYLAIGTLCVGLAIGLWQVVSVRRAKLRNSHSALAEHTD